MKVSGLQMDVVLGDRKKNQEKVRKMVSEAMDKRPDVLVLPELWDLGFFPKNALELGDVGGELAQKFLSELAREHQVNIVGGSIVRREGDQIFNSQYVYDRQGSLVATYDKVHLFSPSGEHEIFQKGDRSADFELDGVKMGSIICYDLRFTEWVRMVALEGAQVLFAPAAWPHPRLNHWRLLGQVRAIENQFFVVAVNHSGEAYQLDFCGHSQMVDPWGEVIVEAGDGEEILTGELDFSVIQDIRERINVFRDRRPELYEVNKI